MQTQNSLLAVLELADLAEIGRTISFSSKVRHILLLSSCLDYLRVKCIHTFFNFLTLEVIKLFSMHTKKERYSKSFDMLNFEKSRLLELFWMLEDKLANKQGYKMFKILI